MRRLASILAVLILLAGCAGSTATTSPAASEAASPMATAPVASATPAAKTAVPSASPTGVSARVTFDGTSCVYTGPTVIPSPATLMLEYAPTPDQQGSAVVWYAIESETTQADIDAVSADPAYSTTGLVPGFMLQSSFGPLFGTGSADVPLQVYRKATGETYDKYMIRCMINQGSADERFLGPGATLQLVEG